MEAVDAFAGFDVADVGVSVTFAGNAETQITVGSTADKIKGRYYVCAEINGIKIYSVWPE